MANEQTEKLLKALKLHANKLFLGGMGVLLAAQGYLWFDESSTPDPEVVPPTPREVKFAIATDPSIVKDPKASQAATANYQILQLIIQTPPEFGQTAFKPLADFNMFDAKAAKNSEQLEKEADKIVEEARGLRAAGKNEEAKAALKRALEIRIGHKGAEALLAEIGAAAGAEGAPE